MLINCRKQIRHIFQCDQWEYYRDNLTTSSSVLSIYELCKSSYIDLDDLNLIPNIIGVIYATLTCKQFKVLKLTVQYYSKFLTEF